MSTKQPTIKKQTKVRRFKRLPRLPKHPFILPVILFLITFFAGCATFILFSGHTLKPDDSHVVRLYIDGTQQELPTRATTVKDLLNRLHMEVHEHDIVEPSLDAPITEDNFQINVYRARAITILDQGKKIPTVSAQQSLTDVVKAAGIAIVPEDIVQAQPPDNVLVDGLISQKLVVQRATPVFLNLYGSPIPLRTQAKTVGDVLNEKNIKLLDGDTVTPDPSTPITQNLQIFILAKGKTIEMREEVIAVQTITTNDPNLPVGQTKVKEAGSPGKKIVTYEVHREDGKELGRRVIQEIVAVEMVKKVVLQGSKVVETRIAGDKSAILSAAGVPVSQQYAADFVIARESGWNLAARSGSGCLGLGQACPASKLTSACPNWQTDATCQIKYFSGYANGRYGSWQGAQNFWLVNHWW